MASVPIEAASVQIEVDAVPNEVSFASIEAAAVPVEEDAVPRN